MLHGDSWEDCQLGSRHMHLLAYHTTPAHNRKIFDHDDSKSVNLGAKRADLSAWLHCLLA